MQEADGSVGGKTINYHFANKAVGIKPLALDWWLSIIWNARAGGSGHGISYSPGREKMMNSERGIRSPARRAINLHTLVIQG